MNGLMTSPLIPHLFSQEEWEDITKDPLGKAYRFVDEKCYWKANAIMNLLHMEPKTVSAFRLKVAKAHYQDGKYDLAFELLMQVLQHPEERKKMMEELADKSNKAQNYLNSHVS
jgi:hypothetical protein